MKIFDAHDAIFLLNLPAYDSWFLIAFMASLSEGLALRLNSA
ncbi:hypothetical protein [Staphylococcus intermedius]|nr:hypothetical protein [Staphylococcus intermedius]